MTETTATVRRAPAAPPRYLAQRAGDMTTRHGYTMAALHELTVHAVNDAKWTKAANAFRSYQERYEWALGAIIEQLYASTEPPSPDALTHAGKTSIRQLVEAEYQTHGVNPATRTGPNEAIANKPNFVTYWWNHSNHTRFPEDRIIETIALSQIWPRILPRYREILTALAQHRDHETAAASLGHTVPNFRTQLCHARRQFLRYWHEGETPSRIWGRTTRTDTSPATRAHTITTITLRRRRQERARHARAPQTGPTP